MYIALLLRTINFDVYLASGISRLLSGNEMTLEFRFWILDLLMVAEL